MSEVYEQSRLIRKPENSYAEVICRPCISTFAQFHTQQFAVLLHFTTFRNTMNLQHSGGNCCIYNGMASLSPLAVVWGRNYFWHCFYHRLHFSDLLLYRLINILTSVQRRQFGLHSQQFVFAVNTHMPRSSLVRHHVTADSIINTEQANRRTGWLFGWDLTALSAPTCCYIVTLT